ncbi:RagB/SusD family nutrient uptake outer membrane protein [Formosa sp. A9]|uniref:RagB/SusD family nutrient uptake outer membrane protein n=1 Tax=Formosa sp. A9 TaxID=3442641 RepID=UPI003EBDBF1F
MKIKFTILLGIGSLLIATSCTNLDEDLYDRVQDSNFGQTSKEVETLVGGAYSSLRGFADEISNNWPASEYVFFLNEVSSDEAIIPTRGTDWYDGGQYIEAHRHTWNAQNKMILSAWRYNYAGISKINSIIYQIDKSGLTDEAKTPIYAELKAVRAYYYYNLLDLFGNVPIITDFEDLDLPSNASRLEVFQFVETELLEAIPYLQSGKVYSKFTQNVANALLARLYLNAEAFVGTARWQDCLEVCQKISGYSLEPDFYANFATNNETSNEIILAIPYANDAGTLGNYMSSMSYHYLQRFAVSPTGDYPWSANGMCATPGVYSMFEETDRRKASMLQGDQINLSTGSVIIMDSGEPLSYTEEVSNLEDCKQNEGVRLNKYEINAGDQWERDNDFVLIRYAEILLMQAECYVRLGAPDLARPFVEQITARAGIEIPTAIDLEYLDKELLREFLFEGKRRTDNIRFGTFFQPWWGSPNATPAYRAIFPIPQQELDKNSNLEQNPGY